jgi:Flp pilus assembly protein TadG
MVEFAFAAMALLLVFFGIIEYGRALYAYHTVANAARIGARWAMVRGSASCAGTIDHCNASSLDVQAYIQSQVPILDGNPLEVQADWPGSNAGCTSSTDFHSAGCPVVVTVKHTFDFAIPLISQIALPMTSSSEMRISQ